MVAHPNSFGEELLESIRAKFPRSEILHTETLPARTGRHGEWPSWLPQDFRDHLVDQGIAQPWAHQVRVANALWDRHDAVVATGTSSGKSLGYQMPILTTLAQQKNATALYLTPTKALANDQLAHVAGMTREVGSLRGVSIGGYDGDTSPEARRAIRDSVQWVFTNPDMVQLSVLGAHARWGRLLRNLRYIVVDECHAYRGMFGAHVSLVLRRLDRLARAYGASPVFVMASATASRPAVHASRLCGHDADDFVEVTDDASPAGERTVVLWEPSFLPDVEGEHGAPVRKPATQEAADVMANLVAQGARTLTFVRSRRSAETVAARASEALGRLGRPEDAARIAAYRAGYLAEDRRKLEHDLDNGKLLGVATTNALELGVDIGGLDSVVACGYPGTIASFWQQAGRAGRRGQGSLVTLIARDEPMDTYLVHHPEVLLGSPVEQTVFNPHNPYVMVPHLYCAAVERPLTDEEIDQWDAWSSAEYLRDAGLLRHRRRGWFAVERPIEALSATDDAEARGAEAAGLGALLPPDISPVNAHSVVSIRGDDGGDIAIVEGNTGRLVGVIDQGRAMSQTHTGAVYLHQGDSYVVDDLSVDDGVALVHREAPAWTTWARENTDIRVLSTLSSHELGDGVWLAFVEVEVTHQVVDYMRRMPSGEVLDVVSLDLTEQTLTTTAVAYTVEPSTLRRWGVEERDWPGSLHAAEHAAIGMLPLIATCDRWDIGGVSTALHQDTGLPTVFVYDGYPGGAGFAECGYQRFHEWITATAEAVAHCECENGCPSCVQSPKCGNGNEPLDKAGAVRVLRGLESLGA